MAYPIMPSLPFSMAKGLTKKPNFSSQGQETAAGMGNSFVSQKPYPTWDYEFDLDHVQGNESLANSVISQFMGTYMACQGRASLFIFQDSQDNTVVNMIFGTGDGSTKNFQLSRAIGGATDVIQTTVGSINIYVNNVLNTANSLSATGVVQFTTAPANGATLTWSGQFAQLCRFSEDTIDSVRSFTTNSGVDQWNVSSVKFSSEFVQPAGGVSGIVLPGGGGGGIFLPAPLNAVVTNPSGSQTINSYDLNLLTGNVYANGFISNSNLNPATAGIVRLAKNESVQWRNNANTGNLALGVNASDQLTFNGSPFSAGVTSVSTSGLATGGPITTTGTITVTGSGSTSVAATAATGLATAPNGDVITADGSGNVKDSGTLLSSLAPLASPTFTGTVTVPTPLTADNSTKAASTAFVKAQGYLTSLPNPSASTLGGIESYAAVTHQWINAISTSGVPSSTQPAFSDISGTATSGQLPATTVYTGQANTFGAFVQTFQGGANHLIVDPTDTTKKFQFDVSNVATSTTRTVNIPNANSTTVQADTGASNNFLTAISAQGVISKAQPSFSNISGTISAGQLPSRTASINYVIDGGGSAPTTGAKGQINIPVACTVTGWVLTADASGSAVVDVLRSTYSGFPTTSSIAGTDKPTLSSVQKNENLSISAWGSTSLSAGDQLQFNLNSVTTCTRLNITLIVAVPWA